MPAQLLAQTRPGATGALLFSAALPASEFGGSWPQGVPLQIHMMEDDEWALEDIPAARELVETAEGAELFLYPGDRHLFADSSLPDYDERRRDAARARVLAFLRHVAIAATASQRPGIAADPSPGGGEVSLVPLRSSAMCQHRGVGRHQHTNQKGPTMSEPASESPILDLLMTMNLAGIEASSLDAQSLMLVRMAALVAVDAPPVSYMLNLRMAGEVDLDAETVEGMLAAIAPIVGVRPRRLGGEQDRPRARARAQPRGARGGLSLG